MDNIGIDVPAGKIASLQFKPINEKNEPAVIDGAVIATVVGDSATEVEVGGVDGLFVDIKIPDAVDSVASVEVTGDPDPAPGRQDEQVLKTIINLRRLGEVPGKAVSLGGTAETVTFKDVSEFGVFPEASARRR